jgi:uncharacterized protein YqgV (UPF0045/DUF77 family)
MSEPREEFDYQNREYGTVEKDLSSVVAQVQKLVEEYHEVKLQVGRLSDRIPEALDERMIRMEFQLQQILKDVETEYVTQKEFAEYRVEHLQMKRLMWGFLFMVMTSVIGAWLALVVQNANSLVK